MIFEHHPEGCIYCVCAVQFSLFSYYLKGMLYLKTTHLSDTERVSTSKKKKKKKKKKKEIHSPVTRNDAKMSVALYLSNIITTLCIQRKLHVPSESVVECTHPMETQTFVPKVNTN